MSLIQLTLYLFTDTVLLLIYKKSTIYESPDFSNIGKWDSYRVYMNTDLANSIKRPVKALFSYREFNSIAKDNKEE